MNFPSLSLGTPPPFPPPQEPLIIVGDVCEEGDCSAMLRQTLEHFHRLDVLVNNAGILEMGTIETTSLDQYDRVMNTNVRAVYHLTMLAVPHLAETRGNIVNVSSVNGIRSFPGVLAYNISKAAVDQGCVIYVRRDLSCFCF